MFLERIPSRAFQDEVGVFRTKGAIPLSQNERRPFRSRELS